MGGLGGFLPLILPLVGSKFGLVGIVLVVGAVLALNMCSVPMDMAPQGAAPGGAPAGPEARSQLQSDTDSFVARVLATTEDTWSAIFAANGERYAPPTLVFFEGGIRSGCGGATSESGPFYCPADRKVYLDTGFFDELARRFGAPGDFAAAYVIAHEVGHHVQTVTGISQQVQARQQRARSRAEANQLSTRLELQADCFAGVWAARNRGLLEPGDFDEGVRAAQAIGDDTLQKRSQGFAVPDSFTHGSAAQRVRWLTRGFESGDPNACDTFGIPYEQL
jgi:predicted metalloprotease